jgi:diacylglycerol kinase (ATP)
MNVEHRQGRDASTRYQPLDPENKPSIGLKRLINATLFSLAGLKAAWRNEEAFRLECLAAIVMTPTAFWLGRTAVERALLVGTCWLVLIVELLNSAVESAVDRVGTDHHTLSGRAKDLGSAAVFVSLMLTLLVWVLVIVERFG